MRGKRGRTRVNARPSASNSVCPHSRREGDRMVGDLIDSRRIEPSFLLGERPMLEGWLDFHRVTLLLKCEGPDDAQRKARPVPTSLLSLHGLLRHMAEVERNWFRRVLTRESDTPPIWYDPAVEDSELVPLDDADWEADLAAWHAECEHSRTEAAAASTRRHRDTPRRAVLAALDLHPHDRGVRRATTVTPTSSANSSTVPSGVDLAAVPQFGTAPRCVASEECRDGVPMRKRVALIAALSLMAAGCGSRTAASSLSGVVPSTSLSTSAWPSSSAADVCVDPNPAVPAPVTPAIPGANGKGAMASAWSLDGGQAFLRAGDAHPAIDRQRALCTLLAAQDISHFDVLGSDFGFSLVLAKVTVADQLLASPEDVAGEGQASSHRRH